MKTNYLFPHRLRVVSGLVFTIAVILLVLLYIADTDRFNINTKVFAIIGDKGFFQDTVTFSWIENSVTDEILMLLSILFGIIFAFSKEKSEDEMVAAVRLQSLAWATIINYIIILFGYLFVYGLVFINVLMAAVISQLIIFIILFRIKMYYFYKTAHNEE